MARHCRARRSDTERSALPGCWMMSPAPQLDPRATPSWMDEPLSEDCEVVGCPKRRGICTDQVLLQAFRAAMRSLLLWSFVKVFALHVDEMQICIVFCMILMMNAAADASCYGPADIETGILSRDLSWSHHQGQGRHCRLLKILVVILRQFYIMVILNTRFCQRGFRSFTWTKKSRYSLRHRCAVRQRWGTNLSQIDEIENHLTCIF